MWECPLPPLFCQSDGKKKITSLSAFQVFSRWLKDNFSFQFYFFSFNIITPSFLVLTTYVSFVIFTFKQGRELFIWYYWFISILYKNICCDINCSFFPWLLCYQLINFSYSICSPSRSAVLCSAWEYTLLGPNPGLTSVKARHWKITLLCTSVFSTIEWRYWELER